MLSLTATLALALPLLALASAQSLDLSKTALKGVSYGGTGCPQKSLDSFTQTGPTTYVASFKNFTAATGPAIAPEEARKNCQINLSISYPAHLQYSLASVKYTGETHLDRGVKGTLSTINYFSGQTAQGATAKSFDGPLSAGYVVTQGVDAGEVVWGDCGASAALNVNSAFALTGGDASAKGEITDSGNLEFELTWRKC